MNQSVKAVLLSALIFPGIGHISAGYKKRGWIIVTLTIALIFLIIRESIKKAHKVIAEATKNGHAVDIEAISNVTSGLSGFSDNLFLNSLLILLVILWIFSIVDGYRLPMIK